MRTASSRHSLALLAVLLCSAAGCGPTSEAPEPSAPATLQQDVVADNGLSLNGLSLNGLSLNGLSLNGLSLNGLSTSAFASWFQSNPALSDEVMRYLVRCAVPAGQTRTYRDALSGKSYTWSGVLGLTPSWAGGAPATETEQQVISACLAAHANKYGVNVPISVLGRDGRGAAIPYSQSELDTYPKQEACFFGNLFQGQGIFVGAQGHLLDDTQSDPRMCALASNQQGSPRVQCPPLQFAGDCHSLCTVDASGQFFTSCKYKGVTYQPLTTRLRDQDIYKCGDGVCEVSESCGNSNVAASCQADCGPCH